MSRLQRKLMRLKQRPCAMRKAIKEQANPFESIRKEFEARYLKTED